MTVPVSFSCDGSTPSDFHVFVDEKGVLTLYVIDISGRLLKAHYVNSKWDILLKKEVSRKPLRNLVIHNDLIFMTSSSGHIYLLPSETDDMVNFKRLRGSDGIEAEISSFCLLPSEEDSEYISAAVGDDNGNVYIVKLDRNNLKCKVETIFQEQNDSITKLYYHQYRKTLLASSADGTLLVIDRKKNKIIAHTSSLDDDILSMSVDAHDNVICSTGLGAIVRYKWGYWGKISSRLKPSFHSSSSINSICLSVAHPDLLVTGTVDGIVRSVSLIPELSLMNPITTLDDSVEVLKTLTLGEDQLGVASLTNDSRIFFFNLLPKTSNHEPSQKRKKAAAKATDTSALNSFFQGLE